MRARLAGAVASIMAAATAVVTTAGPAAALPVPTNPDNPEVAEAWANPAIRPSEGSQVELSLVDAPLHPPNRPFHVKLRVHNRSDETVEGLAVVPRRGPATGSVWDQRVAMVAQVSEYTVVGSRRELASALGPGDSVDVELTIDPDELPLPAGVAYPVMFQLTDAAGATLDTERFHTAAPSTLPDGAAPAGLTALYPISADVDIVPGETGEAPEDPPLVLASEQLAEQLAPGGRLAELVDAYVTANTDPEIGRAVGTATCAALDPALIDTVERMTRGYTVAEERAPAVEEPKRLRDSWGDQTAARGTPGTGSEDAAAWLEKVRGIAITGCTVALPWANTDVNAVVRTGDPWLMREAIERGPFVLGRVLGTSGTQNVVIPPSGYAAEDTVPALGWADHARSTIPVEGLSGPFERAVAEQEEHAGGASATGGRSSLDRPELAAPAWAAAPAPETPVRVLVPASTVDRAPAEDGAPERFAQLADGITAVRYHDSLAATWATVGEEPLTAGYSNDALRYDFAKDAPRARALNAAASVQLAVQNAYTWEGQPEAEPVLVNPPANWDADAAATLLATVAELLSTGVARPVTFGDYLAVPEGAPVPPATRTGSPFDDPTVYADTEILAATQQASFINDLSTLLAPDSSIALTRYGFTLPLRRDILAAFAPAGRRSMEGYPDAVAQTAARLGGSRAALGELRSAVTLIPPGNVYTRTSPTSPLLIVAQNGMPLPVNTAIRYTAPDGATLHVPEQLRIPARGSVTVQMTADLPQDARATNLQLYLASPQGRAISAPVDISVRTPSMAVRGWVLVTAGAVLLALLLLYSVGKRQRRDRPPRAAPRGAPARPTKRRQAPPPTTRDHPAIGERRDPAG